MGNLGITTWSLHAPLDSQAQILPIAIAFVIQKQAAWQPAYSLQVDAT